MSYKLLSKLLTIVIDSVSYGERIGFAKQSPAL